MLLMTKQKVSIIIPAYNEEKYIEKTLEALTMLDRQADEIIVVDNGSTDKTVAIAKKFPQVTVVSYTEKKGPNAARQAGFKASCGDVIATLDADCTPPKEWLTRALALLNADEGTVAATGSYDYTPKPFWWGKPVNDLYTYILIPTTSKLLGLLDRGVMVGGNAIIKRSALEEIGGFNTSIPFHGDDTDTANRLLKVGKVRYGAKMTVPSSSRRLIINGVGKTLKKYARHALLPKQDVDDVDHPR